MTFDTILKILITIGIPTIAGVFIYIGRKLQILDDLEKDCDDFGKDIGSIDKRLIRVETKLGIEPPITGYSSLRLTPTGEEILEKSGMGEIIVKFKSQILQQIKKKNPKTPYDTQETTKEIFQEFNFDEESLTKIKDYCFRNPQWDISDVLDVGAIYFFRKFVAPEFNINLEDSGNDSPANI